MTEHQQERSFGISVGAVFGCLTLWTAWRHHTTASWILGSLAVPLLVLGWLQPSWLRIPCRLWWRLAKMLGWINARLLLSAFFVVVVTPVGLLRRAGGWDPLQRRRAAGASGWVPCPERHRDPKHYERMY